MVKVLVLRCFVEHVAVRGTLTGRGLRDLSNLRIGDGEDPNYITPKYSKSIKTGAGTGGQIQVLNQLSQDRTTLPVFPTILFLTP